MTRAAAIAAVLRKKAETAGIGVADGADQMVTVSAADWAHIRAIVRAHERAEAAAAPAPSRYWFGSKALTALLYTFCLLVPIYDLCCFLLYWLNRGLRRGWAGLRRAWTVATWITFANLAIVLLAYRLLGWALGWPNYEFRSTPISANATATAAAG